MDNSVLFILVLYKTTLKESTTFETLSKLLRHDILQKQLFIYNNSPEIPITSDCGIIQIASKNEMLVGAYNAGLQHAQDHGFRWIILLDQDTEITASYIDAVNTFINDPKNAIAAVPTIQNNNRILSPFWYNPNKGPFANKSHQPKHNECLTAFNSGVILQVEFLLSIGGFNSQYPLDYLDYWYFHKIYLLKQEVTILHATLTHSLSVLNYRDNMTKARYKSLLAAEKQFATQLGKQALFYYKFRLLGRCVKLCIKMPQYIGITLRSIIK
jgi:hypothetical protein